MASLPATFTELKQAAKQLLDGLPQCTSTDEVNNGLKAFNLMYLGLHNATDLEQHQAALLFDIINRKCMEHEFELMS